METIKDSIFKLVRLEKIFLLKYKNLITKILQLVLLLSLFLIIVSDKENLSKIYLLEKIFLLSSAFYLIFLYLNLFFYNFFSKKINSCYDINAGRVLLRFLKLTKKLKLDYFSQDIFLYSLISINSPLVNFIFQRGLLPLGQFRKELKEKIFQNKIFDQKGIENIILIAEKLSKDFKNDKIGIGELLIALSQENKIFNDFLNNFDISSNDLKNLLLWYDRLIKEIENSKKFWERENLLKKGILFNDLAYSFTITLDKFSLDWQELIKKRGYEEIFGREVIVRQIEQVLERETQNDDVLIVGEPDVGKKSILHFLAQKIFFGKSLPKLNGKRILELDVFSIISQAGSMEVAYQILDKCFQEALIANNIILVIDDIHNFLGTDEKTSFFNIAGLLMKYLPYPNFRLIGITTYESFHRIIEKNSQLLTYFEKIEIPEISLEDTFAVVENFALGLEVKYRKFIPYITIRESIQLSQKYLPNLLFPKKALETLEGATIFVNRYTKSKIVLPEHVQKIIAEKTKIPIGDVKKKEKEILLNLESLIHQGIVDQEEAVKEIAAALRRARSGIKTKKGPIGVFLFLGPTGVGKTETAKALSRVYFGGEDKIIRFDMSEFQNPSDIDKLIGSEDFEGYFTKVKDNPFSLILLDELEKANSKVLNLFLQIFDEGYVTDFLSRKIDFQNTIIIATSNAGAEIIREDIQKDKSLDIVKENLLDYLLKNNIFSPEFINRFDAVLIFKPLSKENLLEIADLLLKKVKENLSSKGIEFMITEDLKEKIVELSYNPEFGAREMRRAIQNTVENAIANALLSDKIKKGDKIKVLADNFEVINL
jgi:ATP-dependent Clp protease ATP-binding subunit ClpC